MKTAPAASPVSFLMENIEVWRHLLVLALVYYIFFETLRAYQARCEAAVANALHMGFHNGIAAAQQMQELEARARAVKPKKAPKRDANG